MADATSTFDRLPPPPPAPPRGWAEAFAALPEETPPADVWPALAARARHGRAQRQRRALRSGLAIAATLACAAFGLALWSMQEGRQDTAEAASRHALATETGTPVDTPVGLDPPAARTAAADDASHAQQTAPLAALQSAAATPVAADARTADGATTQPAPLAARRTSLPGPRRGERPRRATLPRPPTAETLVLPVERRLAGVDTGTGLDVVIGTETGGGAEMASPSVAVSDAQASLAESTASIEDAAGGAVGDAALRRLQARSAQLEAWLTLLRDPSVGTGPGALIAAELDDRLAGIDAALAVVPSEGADVQRELWQARVVALQRALVFESALRALAAEGRGYDGALVAVD